MGLQRGKGGNFLNDQYEGRHRLVSFKSHALRFDERNSTARFCFAALDGPGFFDALLHPRPLALLVVHPQTSRAVSFNIDMHAEAGAINTNRM